MTQPGTASPSPGRSIRGPVLWGVVFGLIQAASPLGFWWLDPATVYALSLTLIAAAYVGFAVADGRRTVIAVEAAIAGVFVIVAAAGVTGPAWLLVAAVLPGRRLGRRCDPCAAARRRRRLPRRDGLRGAGFSRWVSRTG